MAQGKFRALEVPEAGGALEHAHGEEQHQQAIADPHHGVVDAGDHRPDVPAFEALRGLRQQGPYLGQFAVPVRQRVFQDIDDPVVANANLLRTGNCVS